MVFYFMPIFFDQKGYFTCIRPGLQIVENPVPVSDAFYVSLLTDKVNGIREDSITELLSKLKELFS